MKTQGKLSIRRGFTLIELMVAMAITTIIVSVLVSVTSIAIDTWNRSRSELRAARQAKAMIDTMARDFEAMVVRSGNSNEWLSAVSPQTGVGDNVQSSNSAELIFFTAATDRYDGDIGSVDDKGGDISCVAYQLEYKDPLEDQGQFRTFVLNRLLVDPDETFEDFLGKDDLESEFQSLETRLSEELNFVCENVFQFTVTFHVRINQQVSGDTRQVDVPVTVGRGGGSKTTDEFKIKGTGIEVSGVSNATEIEAGRVTAMELSITVLTDFAVDQLRNRNFSAAQESEFVAKHSYQYSKLVELPGM